MEKNANEAYNMEAPSQRLKKMQEIVRSQMRYVQNACQSFTEAVSENNTQKLVDGSNTLKKAYVTNSELRNEIERVFPSTKTQDTTTQNTTTSAIPEKQTPSNDAKTCYNLGTAYYRLGNNDKAIEIKPSDSEARNNFKKAYEHYQVRLGVFKKEI